LIACRGNLLAGSYALRLAVDDKYGIADFPGGVALERVAVVRSNTCLYALTAYQSHGYPGPGDVVSCDLTDSLAGFLSVLSTSLRIGVDVLSFLRSKAVTERLVPAIDGCRAFVKARRQPIGSVELLVAKRWQGNKRAE